MATAKIPGLENLLAGYDVFGAFANVDSSRQTLFQEGPNETSLQQRLTSQAAADINNASFHPADLIAKYGTHYVRSLSVGGKLFRYTSSRSVRESAPAPHSPYVCGDLIRGSQRIVDCYENFFTHREEPDRIAGNIVISHPGAYAKARSK